MDSWCIPLDGRTVGLRPLEAGRLDALWAALDHDEIWDWMPIGRPGAAEFRDFFAWLLEENAAGRLCTWVVARHADGEIIGTSSFLAIRREHRGIEIGMTMYTPAAWRTGANREAKLLMLGHAFETLGLQRVEFKTDARNERSRRALEALPAQFEGIFRRHMDTAQGVRDSAYYSVIDCDWPQMRASLIARLES